MKIKLERDREGEDERRYMVKDNKRKGKSKAKIEISKMIRKKGEFEALLAWKEGREFYFNSLPHSVSSTTPFLPGIVAPSCTFFFFFRTIAIHFTNPLSSFFRLSVIFKLPLSSPPPPHPPPPAHPFSLSLTRSLYLSHSLTEADVGQCVWSLSGAAESLRAPRLVLVDPNSDCPSWGHHSLGYVRTEPTRLTWTAWRRMCLQLTRRRRGRGGDMRCLCSIESLVCVRCLHVGLMHTRICWERKSEK